MSETNPGPRLFRQDPRNGPLGLIEVPNGRPTRPSPRCALRTRAHLPEVPCARARGNAPQRRRSWTRNPASLFMEGDRRVKKMDCLDGRPARQRSTGDTVREAVGRKSACPICVGCDGHGVGELIGSLVEMGEGAFSFSPRGDEGRASGTEIGEFWIGSLARAGQIWRGRQGWKS